MAVPPFPNAQNNPAAATPVWLAPSPNGGFANLSTNTQRQLLSGAGMLTAVTINSAGTTSNLQLYDGLSSVVTITIAAPGVVSWATHSLAAGAAVKFYTTGALPTGLTAGTTYYVSTVGLTADVFSVADTQAHALAGTNTVTTSGSQSGVQMGYDVTNQIATIDTTAVNSLAYSTPLTIGLIAIAAGGAAANTTISWA